MASSKKNVFETFLNFFENIFTIWKNQKSFLLLAEKQEINTEKLKIFKKSRFAPPMKIEKSKKNKILKNEKTSKMWRSVLIFLTNFETRKWIYILKQANSDMFALVSELL